MYVPWYLTCMLAPMCTSWGHVPHTLWTCKVLKSFCNSVFNLISHLTGTITVPCHSLALFGIWLDCFPKQYLTLVSHRLIEARMKITSKWKQILTPNISEVICRVNVNYACEKHIAGLNHSLHTFKQIWMTLVTVFNLHHIWQSKDSWYILHLTFLLNIFLLKMSCLILSPSDHYKEIMRETNYASIIGCACIFFSFFCGCPSKNTLICILQHHIWLNLTARHSSVIFCLPFYC